MAYGKKLTLEEINENWELERKVSLELWGKKTRCGAFYKRWLERYEKQLEEEESWLRTNPNNPYTRANVERLRKLVEDYRKWEATCP